MVILQVFLFSRIGISIYVNPLVYIAFLILLPMEIAGALLLVLGMVLGMTVDFFMGTAGINTIATLFAAFCRPAVLTLLVGKDEVKEGGVPNVNRIGLKRFLRYAGVDRAVARYGVFCAGIPDLEFLLPDLVTDHMQFGHNLIVGLFLPETFCSEPAGRVRRNINADISSGDIGAVGTGCIWPGAGCIPEAGSGEEPAGSMRTRCVSRKYLESQGT